MIKVLLFSGQRRMRERDLFVLLICEQRELKARLKEAGVLIAEPTVWGHLAVAWQVTYRNCHNR